jgi:hypothetical protein
MKMAFLLLNQFFMSCQKNFMNIWWLGFIYEFPLGLNHGHIVIILQSFVKFMYTCSIKRKIVICNQFL